MLVNSFLCTHIPCIHISWSIVSYILSNRSLPVILSLMCCETLIVWNRLKYRGIIILWRAINHSPNFKSKGSYLHILHWFVDSLWLQISAIFSQLQCSLSYLRWRELNDLSVYICTILWVSKSTTHHYNNIVILYLGSQHLLHIPVAPWQRQDIHLYKQLSAHCIPQHPVHAQGHIIIPLVAGMRKIE